MFDRIGRLRGETLMTGRRATGAGSAPSAPNRDEDAMKKIGSLRFAILAAVILSGSVNAWAMDNFQGVLKKLGVTDNTGTSKKACLCVGGPFDRSVGLLLASLSGSPSTYHYECGILTFDAQGNEAGGAGCLSNGGSSVVVLPK